MVYINPTAISNSGNEKYFTNQRSKIALGILNILSNAELLTNFLVEQYEEQKALEQTNQTNQLNQINNDSNDFRNILFIQKANTKTSKFKN